MLRRILDQDRTPVCTALSLVATILTVALLGLEYLEWRKSDCGFVCGVLPLFLFASGVVGALIVGGIGVIAAKRDEVMSEPIAAMAAVLCFFTGVALALLLIRHP